MRVLPFRTCIHSLLVALILISAARAQSAIEYRLSFADAIHHVMDVDATFHGVPAGPLHVHMSRSSAGRYAAVDFAKNVFMERFTDGKGTPLAPVRPNPQEWDVTSHDGTVHVTYRVFGDRVDGTYLAVDSTHAHMNFPAVLMWAKGLENRPVRLTFVQPAGSTRKIASQLYPTKDPLVFTAPNFQYLMDSPTEFSDFGMRSFTVPALQPGGKTQTFRVTVHHLGTDADLDAYAAGIEKIVREEQAIFG